MGRVSPPSPRVGAWGRVRNLLLAWKAQEPEDPSSGHRQGGAAGWAALLPTLELRPWFASKSLVFLRDSIKGSPALPAHAPSAPPQMLGRGGRLCMLIKTLSPSPQPCLHGHQLQHPSVYPAIHSSTQHCTPVSSPPTHRLGRRAPSGNLQPPHDSGWWLSCPFLRLQGNAQSPPCGR